MRVLLFWLCILALAGTACGGSTATDAGADPRDAPHADADQDACADFCGGS